MTSPNPPLLPRRSLPRTSARLAQTPKALNSSSILNETQYIKSSPDRKDPYFAYNARSQYSAPQLRRLLSTQKQAHYNSFQIDPAPPYTPADFDPATPQYIDVEEDWYQARRNTEPQHPPLPIQLRPSRSLEQMRRLEPLQGCSCKNSRCLKLYCQCFGGGKFCDPQICRCFSCRNVPYNRQQRDAAMKVALERNPHAFKPKITTGKKVDVHLKGCTCKKSGCLKKYCECFQAGVLCGGKCRCRGCQNILANLQQIQKMQSAINEQQQQQRSYSQRSTPYTTPKRTLAGSRPPQPIPPISNFTVSYELQMPQGKIERGPVPKVATFQPPKRAARQKAYKIPKQLVSLPKPSVVRHRNGSLLVKRPYSLFAEYPTISDQILEDVLPFDKVSQEYKYHMFQQQRKRSQKEELQGKKRSLEAQDAFFNSIFKCLENNIDIFDGFLQVVQAIKK